MEGVFFLYNGHGDVVQTVCEEGEIENQYDYDIFGNPTLTVEEYSNSIIFKFICIKPGFSCRV
ncbi:MAG TPA: hypothetical protein PLY12_11465 [Bacillota bacterium]|nr:hypothetical protein [Bacillota bacterium]HQO43603.1 hypothetical protein [Bacillota bacterium]HQQ45625.1 hypothetical protein [Bacillota bacterium]